MKPILSRARGVILGALSFALIASAAVGQVPPADDVVGTLESPLQAPGEARGVPGWVEVPLDTPPGEDVMYPRGTRYDPKIGAIVFPPALERYSIAAQHGDAADIPVPSAADVAPAVRARDLLPGPAKASPRTASRQAQPALNKKTYFPFIRQIPGNWKVLVIAYTGATSQGASTIPRLTLEWQTALQQGSSWKNASMPALRPDVYNGSVRVWNKVTPFTTYNGNPRWMNYSAIWAENDVCGLLNSGAIRGVVLWNAGDAKNDREHLYKDGTATGSWQTDAIPTCGTESTNPLSAFFMTYATCYGDDPQDGVCSGTYGANASANAVHSFTHFLEARFARLAATRCDFFVSNGPGPSANNDVPLTNAGTGCTLHERGYIATSRYRIGTTDYTRPSAVCGDIHYPPNAVMPRSVGTNEYRYDLTNSVQNMCWGWQVGTTPTYQTGTCTLWGCSATGFYIWWMRGIPGLNNNHRETSGFVGRNWWLEGFLIPAPDTVYGF